MQSTKPPERTRSPTAGDGSMDQCPVASLWFGSALDGPFDAASTRKELVAYQECRFPARRRPFATPFWRTRRSGLCGRITDLILAKGNNRTIQRLAASSFESSMTFGVPTTLIWTETSILEVEVISVAGDGGPPVCIASSNAIAGIVAGTQFDGVCLPAYIGVPVSEHLILDHPPDLCSALDQRTNTDRTYGRLAPPGPEWGCQKEAKENCHENCPPRSRDHGDSAVA